MHYFNGARVHRYRVPFTEPLRLGGAWHTHREGLVVECPIAGVTGWGEVAPLPGFSTETLDAVLAGMQSGRQGDPAPVPSSVLCGMEGARLLWEAAGHGTPRLRHRSVPVCALLVGTRARILARAAAARTEGYRAVKLKVGQQSLASDVRLVRMVRRTIGPDLSLRLDANRAWHFDEALTFAGVVQEAGVAFVEEPLADPARLPEIARHMPVALDETLAALSLGDLARHRYAAAFVIKPMLLGGAGVAIAMAAFASHLGVQPIISASFETGVGMLSLLHVAARIESDAAAGLDTYRYIKDDVLIPRLMLDGPNVDIPLPSDFALDMQRLTRIA